MAKDPKEKESLDEKLDRIVSEKLEEARLVLEEGMLKLFGQLKTQMNEKLKQHFFEKVYPAFELKVAELTAQLPSAEEFQRKIAEAREEASESTSDKIADEVLRTIEQKANNAIANGLHKVVEDKVIKSPQFLKAVITEINAMQLRPNKVEIPT